jgi:hypothetical protein
VLPRKELVPRYAKPAAQHGRLHTLTVWLQRQADFWRSELIVGTALVGNKQGLLRQVSGATGDVLSFMPFCRSLPQAAYLPAKRHLETCCIQGTSTKTKFPNQQYVSHSCHLAWILQTVCCGHALLRHSTTWQVTRIMVTLSHLPHSQLTHLSNSQIEAMGLRHMQSAVKDPDMRRQLTPKFSVGCKRILTSDEYYPALAADNVKLVASGLKQVRLEG